MKNLNIKIGDTVSYTNNGTYTGEVIDIRTRENWGGIKEYLIVEPDGCREWRSENQIVE